MQNVSSAWHSAASLDSTLYKVTVSINGVDYTTFPKMPVISRYGVPDNLFGGALISSLEVSIIPTAPIPKAAEVIVSIQQADNSPVIYVTDDDGYRLQMDDEAILTSSYPHDMSESIHLGTYYVNTRKPDEKTGIITLHCFDSMRKGDVAFADNVGTYPMDADDAVDLIASLLGVTVAPDSDTVYGAIDNPVGIYTVREVLAYIGAMNGGNFVIDENNRLKFIRLVTAGIPLSSCVAASIGQNGKPVKVSKVILYPDNNTYIEAGTDTYDTVSASCPYAKQVSGEDTAQDVLDMIGGVQYSPATAEIAVLDPAIQVGDTVEVSHQIFRLYNYDLYLGAGLYFNISNSGSYEIQEEYVYADMATRQIDREVAKSYSEIRKDIDSIELEVAGKLDEEEASSLISQGLGSITLSASAGSNKSTVTIAAGGITVDSADVQFNQITADKIRLYGNMTVYTDSSLNTAGGYIGYNAGSQGGYGIGMTDISEYYEIRLTTGGAFIGFTGDSYNDPKGLSVTATGNPVMKNGSLSYGFGASTYGFFPSSPVPLGHSGAKWSEVWANRGTIQTSDRAQKRDIQSLPDEYERLFDDLKPMVYRFNDGNRAHTGLIAQDVEDSLQKAGIDSNDFAGFIKNEDGYALRYDEFIALLIDKVQKLEKRIKELEA